MTRSRTGPQMVHLGSDEQARGMWGCGLRLRYAHGTQRKPLQPRLSVSLPVGPFQQEKSVRCRGG